VHYLRLHGLKGDALQLRLDVGVAQAGRPVHDRQRPCLQNVHKYPRRHREPRPLLVAKKGLLPQIPRPPARPPARPHGSELGAPATSPTSVFNPTRLQIKKGRQIKKFKFVAGRTKIKKSGSWANKIFKLETSKFFFQVRGRARHFFSRRSPITFFFSRLYVTERTARRPPVLFFKFDTVLCKRHRFNRVCRATTTAVRKGALVGGSGCACVSSCACAYVRALVCVCVCACARVRMRTCVCVCACARACVRACLYTHTHSLSSSSYVESYRYILRVLRVLRVLANATRLTTAVASPGPSPAGAQ